MTYWPPGLPEPQFGNACTTAENRLSTEGTCAPRQRIVDANYKQTLSLSWTMTETQYRAFESWHTHRCCDGISWFAMAWTGQQGRARFTGTIQAQLSGAMWSVSGEVELDYAVS